MQRMFSTLPALGLALILAACSAVSAEETAVHTDWTPLQIAQAVWNSQGLAAGDPLLPGETGYDAYLAAYGLAEDQIADGAILALGGSSATETAVFLVEEGTAAGVVSALETYLEGRIGAFTGYFPEEAAMLEGAEVSARGEIVALLACGDMEEAVAAFDRAFTGQPPEETADTAGEPLPWAEPPAPETEPEPPVPETETSVPETASPGSEQGQPAPALERPAPEKAPAPAAEPAPQPEPEPAHAVPQPEPEPEPAPAVPQPEPEPQPEPAPWTYSARRLLDAWAAGDWSGLAAEDQAILDVCREVMDTVVPSSGSDYEKELAVHDWMIAHGSYDSNRLSHLPEFQENPNNDNPYGFLVDGKGICLGYATSFQLFMDLLGIECITVPGTAYSGTSAHAWNQVRLDGEWYCVDVTWDDPATSGSVSPRSAHSYFNVTAQYMRDTDHQWDESAVPAAEGTAHAWA